MSSWRDRLGSLFADDYEATEISQWAGPQQLSPDCPDALRIRPAKDHDGIERARSLLTALHDVETSRWLGKNQSPAHAFEMRYLGGTVDFQIVPASTEWLGPIERQLRDTYPNAQVERDRPVLADLDEDSEQYVAGATLDLERYSLYPIKHPDVEGFDRDPFGSITSEMVGVQRDDRADANVVVQVMFKPAKRSWINGIDGGPSLEEIAYELKQPTFETRRKLFTRERLEVPPSKKQKKAAQIVSDQHGEKGYRLTLRVFAVSSDPDVAVDRAEYASKMYRNYYESATQQTFSPKPLAGSDLRRELSNAIDRDWSETDIVKSVGEVSGLVHVPDDGVNTAEIDWALAKAGTSVPPGTPRFDFEKAGVAGPETSREEKQAAMLADADPGDPIWYGWGARSGTEAGIREETLATHQFIGGATGEGKTTLMKHLFRQLTTRGHGALYYDPKGRDAREFVQMIPDGREDDLVFIEIGGDRDRQVGINFLEVPVDDFDPNDPGHTEALESLTDDAVALLAQAGGEGTTWGARMNRIARNMTRGLGKVGYSCTFLDMYFALISEEQRHNYADMLADERIEWIVEYAREQLAEMDDSDLEPLVGRLQQWVENDILRELVSVPESTVSVEDIVAEGKIVVVRDASTSDTAGALVATALIRRIWVAVREQHMNDDRDDPPRFYAILDEFKEIVSERSNITEILADARAFNLSITAATQDLSGQLGSEVANAIEGQANTFLSFNPGRSGDAKLIAKQHSPEIDDEDLLNLSEYRFYMRTHNERNERTASYKVHALPPFDELDAASDHVRTESEAEELIESSLEAYGTERRSTEDMKQDSHFYSGAPDPTDDETEGLAPNSERARQLTVKAVFDEQLSQGELEKPGVPAPDVLPRLNRHIPSREIGHTSEMWAYLDAVPSSLISRTDNGDHVSVHATESGRAAIFSTGSGASAGGGKHRLLLQESYAPLFRTGLEIMLPEQTGDEDVDGVGRIRETIDTDAVTDSETPLLAAQEMLDDLHENHPLLARLSGGADVTLEAESSTGRSKPGQTVLNLAKATSEGKRCLFLVRPDDADRVWQTLTEPPLVRSVDGARRSFFNHSTPLTIDGDIMLRPGDAHAARWQYDDAADEYLLTDTEGRELARFSDADAIHTDAERYPETATVGKKPDDWSAVYPPVVPDRVFDGEIPGRDAWDVIIVPKDASLESTPDDLRIMVDGDPRPLPTVAASTSPTDDADLDDTEETTSVSATLSSLSNDD